MDSALIVCGADKGVAFYQKLLAESAGVAAAHAKSGAEARRQFIENDYELVLIHSPLPDEYGHELAAAASERTTAGVLLVAKREIADELAQKVEDYGVIVVEWPLNVQMFHQALKIAAASRKRMLRLKTQNVELLRRIDEMKQVDRAKCLLIAHAGMTEPQAHKYIEKQAMDRRMTRREVALSIISSYNG